ncbi:MAG TPA: type II secretion system protein [Terriglobia bacterium]|nr:type II secretion system protein [Terriglobia bacterium]
MQLPLEKSLPNCRESRIARRQSNQGGFSLLEMMVSVLIILLLMSAIFPFILQSQKRFQGNEVVSESNQSARAALEVMSQEIGQAGFNPNFYPNKTAPVATSVPPSALPQCITLNNITGISPGDYVSVDTGPNNEIVQVTSTSNQANGGDVLAGFGECPGLNQIQGIFTACHNRNTTPECNPSDPVGPFPVASFKMPFGGGLLIHIVGGVNDNTESADMRLELYGDINQTGTINYVVYSISQMVPNQTVCIPYVPPGVACAAANTYSLYNLYRSITPVNFYALETPPLTGAQVNTPASPMVEKVLIHCTSAEPCVSGYGPTGKPIFGYPVADEVLVGVVPNQVTEVGTIVVTLCVAVNPKSLETTVVSWYTMATQIRPLNLTASDNVNNSGGGKYLSLIPASLPMTNPANYFP